MTSHQNISLVSSFYNTKSDDDCDEDQEYDEIFPETYNHEEEEEEKYHPDLWSSWRALHSLCGTAPTNKISEGRGKGLHFFSLGRVLDPRATWIHEWNRIFLLVCAIGLFVDPLYVYPLSISEEYLYLFIDGWFAVTVTVLRCMIDALHLWNMWLHLKMANHHLVVNEELANDIGNYDKTVRFVASRYLKTRQGFLFDLFVILPIPQVVIWVIIPYLLRKGLTKEVTDVFFFLFLFQYLPKMYHAVCLLHRMQKFFGDCFGTIGWGFSIKMIAYFVASLAAGACWFLLGLQKVTKCLKLQCIKLHGCNTNLLAAQDPIYYGTRLVIADPRRIQWASYNAARINCLRSDANYDYGAYEWIIYLVTNNSRIEKILMPNFWGLMTMSTFGSLESTEEWQDCVFVICVLTSGLLLVTMLIGHIQVFLHATTSRKQAMQIRMRNIEWWMHKRNIPTPLKHRVRKYEWQQWAAMRGVDELEMIRNLPEGLRRDIKYHLCLDLVKQVPLFQHMDDLVLENICNRVKSLIFTKGEMIIREGDLVQRMIFVVRGHLQSSQVIRDGVKSFCMLGPGNFSGDELLSWCLRRPFIDRLPPSTSTLITLEMVEAFGLEAEDVKYVTQHFRYTFLNEKVRRSARYYSPGWRTWAVVAIQLAWRRYKNQLTLDSLLFIRPRRPVSRSTSLSEDRLRLYTALLTSPKPNQDNLEN